MGPNLIRGHITECGVVKKKMVRVIGFQILLQNQICKESQVLEVVLACVVSWTFTAALALNKQHGHFSGRMASPHTKLTTAAKISWVKLYELQCF